MKKVFNNHLEKCWAVFFEELQIDYSYSAQGFENIEDIHFFLNNMNTYVKILHTTEDITELDIRKFEYFSDKGNINVLWIIGRPNDIKEEIRIFLTNKFTFYPIELIKSDSKDSSELIENFKAYLDFTEVDFAINPFNNKWTLSYCEHRPDKCDYDYLIAMRKAQKEYLDYGPII